MVVKIVPSACFIVIANVENTLHHSSLVLLTWRHHPDRRLKNENFVSTCVHENMMKETKLHCDLLSFFDLIDHILFIQFLSFPTPPMRSSLSSDWSKFPIFLVPNVGHVSNLISNIVQLYSCIYIDLDDLKISIQSINQSINQSISYRQSAGLWHF